MSIESFILIGGNSSRFGSPKALIAIDGEPLLDRTSNTIDTAIPNTKITLVSSGPDQFLGLPNNLPFIFDLYQGRGPLGGLHAALAYAESEWAFIVACDYPFITADLISYLEAHVADDVDAVVPIQPDGRGQPLCAFYRVKPCLEMVESILDRQRPTPPLRAILEDINTHYIPFNEIENLPDSERFFVNLNTPEDLERLPA